ncbi:2-C-methyl-D-erythritol 4-phosphate cytidylyltransferase [candidate division KSB1 bacterium]|nr:2-C-methyl-D-erythritol 4-phosphate cytidylyltransferase [candidate division KSB1 bacterium]RQW01009.1 MAG: 2-C-methyl-D-erythritol 4-phosphate cytidylyltransferase [candidate division KSB1 bacterium]
MEGKNKPIVAALVVAAGSGSRMGGSTLKQFIKIYDKPILQYTLEKFQAYPHIQHIYTILPEEFVGEYSLVIRNKWKITKFVRAVAGGAERHLSVWAGLQALDAEDKIVMIHDGVRPFVSQRILSESIRAAERYGAAVVGMRPKDTVKQIAKAQVKKTLDRTQIVLAQTPQTFRKEIILRANQFAFKNNSFSTDDAALVEQIGETVTVVPGEWQNIKITSPEDLIIARAYIDAEVACA